MNGAVHGGHSVVEIELKRGPAGLGFNIVGGVDQQYVMNDSGIYVAKIKENGAAALDGRLQEGDKILAINGQVLEDLSHSAAVELFRSAGEDVQLRVQKVAAALANGPVNLHRSDGESSFPGLALLGVVCAVVVIGTFAYVRFHSHLRRHF